MNCVILIPAYNPSDKLLKLLKELKKDKYKIIIVNDGSSKDNKIFSKLKDMKYTVLEYSENHGKGYALKYGIKYYLKNLKDKYDGIITVDADYQHLPKDINKIATSITSDTIVLGSRDFNLKSVPILNRIGNKITSMVFKLLYGFKITDTQTGLRGIPNKYLEEAIQIDGDRFEYEMNFLIYFVNHKISLKEIFIETVYYERSESKFHKVIDSIRIYRILLKESFRFLVTSLISSGLDLTLFTLFLYVFSVFGNDLSIILSTFFARIIADFLNLNLTRLFVFDTKEDFKQILWKYYVLSFSKLFASALLVLLISKLLPFNKTLIKMVVDITIYFISYMVQKKYIFKT